MDRIVEIDRKLLDQVTYCEPRARKELAKKRRNLAELLRSRTALLAERAVLIAARRG